MDFKLFIMREFVARARFTFS